LHSLRFSLAWLAAGLLSSGCSSSHVSPYPGTDGGDDADAGAATDDGPNAQGDDQSDDNAADASSEGADPGACNADAAPWDGAVTGIVTHPCNLPGSVQHTATGTVVVPGGPQGHDVSFIKLPVGFCAHYFGNVPNARQLRFAPGGELFVASPTSGTTSGGIGIAAIVVLPDDNADGFADTPITFLGGLPNCVGSCLPSTQGLLFTPGYFYYQDNEPNATKTGRIGSTIRRMPYSPGQRRASCPSEQVIDITLYSDGLHWPKAIDMADDGTIYVGNGGSQGDACIAGDPQRGGIWKIDGTPGGAPVLKGLRNPIGLRCARGHNQCFALELAKDYSYQPGDFGREKMLPIRQGDDWGFPCCATRNQPYANILPTPNCSTIASDTDSFYIGDTPFGVDFEPGNWPGMWAGRAYVALHGAAGSWAGARMVAIAMDPMTGLPLPGSNAANATMDTGALVQFATGWDDGSHSHGRPTAVTFSPDGRLFLSDDQKGDIVWIAPLSL
jgi:glucose/arabinose dehydrogenase